jgi:hypothetical protein
MPNSTLFILALNICVGCLCVAILGLTIHAVNVKERFENDVPASTSSTSMIMLFWPGVGGIVDTILFAILWITRPSHTQRVSFLSLKEVSAQIDIIQRFKQTYKNGILFVATFIVARPFIVLVYTSVESARASNIETWACNVPNEYGSLVDPTGTLCKDLRAVRYLLIPVLVLSILFLGIVIRKIAFAKDDQALGATHDDRIAEAKARS